MIHNMKLHSTPFEMIKSGKKTFELRLYDEKRQKIKVGDEIIFTNTVNGETLNKQLRIYINLNPFVNSTNRCLC